MGRHGGAGPLRGRSHPRAFRIRRDPSGPGGGVGAGRVVQSRPTPVQPFGVVTHMLAADSRVWLTTPLTPQRFLSSSQKSLRGKRLLVYCLPHFPSINHWSQFWYPGPTFPACPPADTPAGMGVGSTPTENPLPNNVPPRYCIRSENRDTRPGIHYLGGQIIWEWSLVESAVGFAHPWDCGGSMRGWGSAIPPFHPLSQACAPSELLDEEVRFRVKIHNAVFDAGVCWGGGLDSPEGGGKGGRARGVTRLHHEDLREPTDYAPVFWFAFT